MFPQNDEEFEEVAIEEVTDVSDSSFTIRRCDGFSFYVDKSSGIVPEVGQKARFYGEGIGRPVRGLFIDGACVFYRTEAEDVEHRMKETYGADAAEWLARWDAGKSVWSVEMGGLGPGYEQAIQIMAAEALRACIELGIDHTKWVEGSESTWKADRESIEQQLATVFEKIGPSGAQVGAALSLATMIYKNGPRVVQTAAKDRHIQVSKNFPSL